jgi:hypothetical protein
MMIYGMGPYNLGQQTLGKQGGVKGKPPWVTQLPYGLFADQVGFIYAYIRLSLFSTAQPLYARFPIIFGTCFSKLTIGCYPTDQVEAYKTYKIPSFYGDMSSPFTSPVGASGLINPRGPGGRMGPPSHPLEDPPRDPLKTQYNALRTHLGPPDFGLRDLMAE